MSERDLEMPDDDGDVDVPEAIRAHAALAVAILALELIADASIDDVRGGAAMARAALGHLYRKHPVSREHIAPINWPTE